jgi:hypothetical protein
MKTLLVECLAVILVSGVVMFAVLLSPYAIEVQQRLNGAATRASNEIVNSWP